MKTKTSLLKLVFVDSLCRSLLNRALLGNLRLLGDNNCHDQIHDGDPAKAGEERQDGEQSDDRRVDAKEFA